MPRLRRHRPGSRGPDPDRAGQAPRRPWSVLLLLSVARFMVVLDVTVVNVALPSIGDALDFAAGDLQWVITAYVLCTGGALLLGGRVADVLGRRPVFLTGLLGCSASARRCACPATPTPPTPPRSARSAPT